jgi:hypothetical protein
MCNIKLPFIVAGQTGQTNEGVDIDQVLGWALKTPTTNVQWISPDRPTGLVQID